MYQLSYDSVHGRFPGTVQAGEGKLPSTREKFRLGRNDGAKQQRNFTRRVAL